MATKIAEAFVELEARSGTLRRDLRRAENRTRQSTRRMQGGFQRVTRSVTALRAGLAGLVTAVGAGAFASLVRQATILADSLDKTSERLGVNVESLQQWRFAADQSGIAARQFDIGLQRFLRRVGEAAAGTGELRDTLEALNFQIIQGEDGTQTLRRFLAALEQIEDPTRRLAAAFKAFDSEGVVFLQFLRDGVDGLDGLLEKAVEAGLVIDQRTIRALTDLKDELGIVGTVAENLGSRIVADLSDELIATARAVARLVVEFDNFLVRAGLLSENLAGQSLEELNEQLVIAQGNLRRLLGVRATAQGGPDIRAIGDRAVENAKERIELLKTQIELVKRRNRAEAGIGEPRPIPDVETEGRSDRELSAIEFGALIDAQIREARRLRDREEDREEERAQRAIERQQRIADRQRRAFAESFADIVLSGEQAAERLREAFIRRFVVAVALAATQQLGGLFGGQGFAGSIGGFVGQVTGLPIGPTAAAAAGGGSAVEVVVNSPLPTQVRQGGGGASVQQVIVDAVGGDILSGGRTAVAIEQRFGVSRSGTRR